MNRAKVVESKKQNQANCEKRPENECHRFAINSADGGIVRKNIALDLGTTFGCRLMRNHSESLQNRDVSVYPALPFSLRFMARSLLASLGSVENLMRIFNFFLPPFINPLEIVSRTSLPLLP